MTDQSSSVGVSVNLVFVGQTAGENKKTEFRLRRGKREAIKLGRLAADIVYDIPNVSTRHAQIRLKEDSRGKFSLVLVDLSSNGTGLKLPQGSEVIRIPKDTEVPLPDGSKVVFPFQRGGSSKKDEDDGRITFFVHALTTNFQTKRTEATTIEERPHKVVRVDRTREVESDPNRRSLQTSKAEITIRILASTVEHPPPTPGMDDPYDAADAALDLAFGTPETIPPPPPSETSATAADWGPPPPPPEELMPPAPPLAQPMDADAPLELEHETAQLHGDTFVPKPLQLPPMTAFIPKPLPLPPIPAFMAQVSADPTLFVPPPLPLPSTVWLDGSGGFGTDETEQVAQAGAKEPPAGEYDQVVEERRLPHSSEGPSRREVTSNGTGEDDRKAGEDEQMVEERRVPDGSEGPSRREVTSNGTGEDDRTEGEDEQMVEDRRVPDGSDGSRREVTSKGIGEDDHTEGEDEQMVEERRVPDGSDGSRREVTSKGIGEDDRTKGEDEQMVEERRVPDGSDGPSRREVTSTGTSEDDRRAGGYEQVVEERRVPDGPDGPSRREVTSNGTGEDDRKAGEDEQVVEERRVPGGSNGPSRREVTSNGTGEDDRTEGQDEQMVEERRIPDGSDGPSRREVTPNGAGEDDRREVALNHHTVLDAFLSDGQPAQPQPVKPNATQRPLPRPAHRVCGPSRPPSADSESCVARETEVVARPAAPGAFGAPVPRPLPRPQAWPQERGVLPPPAAGTAWLPPPAAGTAAGTLATARLPQAAAPATAPRRPPMPSTAHGALRSTFPPGNWAGPPPTRPSSFGAPTPRTSSSKAVPTPGHPPGFGTPTPCASSSKAQDSTREAFRGQTSHDQDLEDGERDILRGQEAEAAGNLQSALGSYKRGIQKVIENLKHLPDEDSRMKRYQLLVEESLARAARLKARISRT